MPSLNLVRAFVVQWWTVGMLLLLWSVQTAYKAIQSGHHDPHLALLGAVEALSALLFLIPGTMRIGATGLKP